MTSVLVRPPSWSGAAHTRNLASLGLRAAYRITAHGAFHAGTEGPLILVTSCESVVTSAVLRAVSPRPVHVLANAAMMRVVPQRAMSAAGDIAVVGSGAIDAQRQALAALADDRVVALAGHGVPTGYIIGASNAPVVPVVILGADGKRPTDPPALRSAVDVYFSAPVTVPVGGDPFRATTRTAVAEHVRQLLTDAEDVAWRRAGFAGAPLASGT